MLHHGGAVYFEIDFLCQSFTIANYLRELKTWQNLTAEHRMNIFRACLAIAVIALSSPAESKFFDFLKPLTPSTPKERGCTPNVRQSINANVRWCQTICFTSDHREECAGASALSIGANNGDINAVRDGFHSCQRGDGRQQQRSEFKVCQEHNPKELLNQIRALYNLVPVP